MSSTPQKRLLLLNSTLLFLLFFSTTLNGFCAGDKNISKRKMERLRKEAMIRHLIEEYVSDTTYYVKVAQGGSSPYTSVLGLPTATVTHDHGISIRKDRLVVKLPFNGAHRSTFRGASFDIDTDTFTYSCVKEDGAKKGWTVEIEVKVAGENVETVTITMQISPMGTVSIGVTSSSRDAVMFMGGITGN